MLTDKLREAVSDLWESYHSHPFVRGIGDGTLPIEKFRAYMIQDYLYLYEYAKVFALGVVKARDHELMRAFAGMVHSTLNGEMTIHEGYMKRLGVTQEMIGKTQMELPNQAYTSYMLREAYEGDALDILIAILACAWSYEEIGQRLNAIPGAAEHPFYGEWIRSYASDEYAAMNRDLIDTVNRTGAELSAEKEERLIRIFTACSQYEGMFWDMAWNAEARDA